MHGNQRWWKQDKGMVHEGAFAFVDDLKDTLTEQDSRLRKWLSLYTARDIQGLEPGSVVTKLRELLNDAGLRLNVIRSAIQTLYARICPHKPRPVFLTSGGNWEDKQKAKLLEKYVEGRFYEMGLYEEGARVMLDSFIFGTGVLKWYVDEEDNVSAERIFPGEIWVDEQAALTSTPRTMVQRKYVDEDVLRNLYPKHAHEIDVAARNTQYISNEHKFDPGQVEVVEIWHLPSGKKAKDGRHAICVRGATLFDERYEYDYFPFSFIRYSENPLGFYGQGVAEDLEGIHLEINKLLLRIQESMHLFSNTIVFTPKGANLKKGHYKNVNGLILEYEGSVPPRVEMPGSVSSEVFSHLQWLYAKAYEISGISQLSAHSKKPSGVESGVAMRTLLDVETQRFSMTSRAWENFFLDCATKLVCMSKELYKGKGNKVKWEASSCIEEIDWADVDLAEDSYVLKIYPTSMLPTEPAGRLAHVEQLIQAGLVSDPEEARSLLGYPDLKRNESFTQASTDYIEYAISQMLIHGEYIDPTEFEVSPGNLKKVASAHMTARREGAPEARVELLERWLADADAIIQRNSAPPQPPQGPPPGAPPMPPEGMPGLPPGMPPGMPPGPPAPGPMG